MEKYYSLRTNEYDDIYLKPERCDDIIKSKNILKKFFYEKFFWILLKIKSMDVK